jgi:hypothetical protein
VIRPTRKCRAEGSSSAAVAALIAYPTSFKRSSTYKAKLKVDVVPGQDKSRVYEPINASMRRFAFSSTSS